MLATSRTRVHYCCTILNHCKKLLMTVSEGSSGTWSRSWHQAIVSTPVNALGAMCHAAQPARLHMPFACVIAAQLALELVDLLNRSRCGKQICQIKINFEQSSLTSIVVVTNVLAVANVLVQLCMHATYLHMLHACYLQLSQELLLAQKRAVWA